MSSIEARPPLAMTGIGTACASSSVESKLRPFSTPSRSISVKTMALTPASEKRLARSMAVNSDVSRQPSTAT